MVGNGTKEYKEIKRNGHGVDDTGCGGVGYIEEGNADKAKDIQNHGKEGEEHNGLSTIAAAEDTISLLATLRREEGGGVDHGLRL